MSPDVLIIHSDDDDEACDDDDDDDDDDVCDHGQGSVSSSEKSPKWSPIFGATYQIQPTVSTLTELSPSDLRLSLAKKKHHQMSTYMVFF